MELLVYPVREREKFPMRTRREQAVERQKTGNRVRVTPIHAQRSALGHDSGGVVIVIVKPRRNFIISRSWFVHDEKRVKNIYSLKQIG